MIAYFVNQVLPNLVAAVLWVPCAGFGTWLVVRFHLHKIADRIADKLRAHITAEILALLGEPGASAVPAPADGSAAERG